MFSFFSRLWATPIYKVYNLLFSVVFSITFLHSTSVQAELLDPQQKFKELTIKDGLSQSFVYDIVEDKEGFIWIATQEGLNRYDGNEFIHYKNNISVNNSVANNFIRKVFIDNTGTLWIGTQNGLSKYNRQADDFENFYNDSNNSYSLLDNVIWDIYQDNENVLWISTESGLHHYDPKDNNFNRVRIRNYENSLKEIKKIFQDLEGNYWLGTYENGIFIVSHDLSNAVSLKAENKWNLSISAESLSDIISVDNHYWLATNNGIYVINKDYKIIKHFHSQSPNYNIPNDQIKTLIQLDSSHVWAGSFNGITTINLHDSKIKQFKKSEYKYSLTNNTTYKLFKSRSGSVWIGNKGGVNIYNSATSIIKQYLFDDEKTNQNVDTFTELSDGKIIITGKENSFFILDTDYKLDKLLLPISSMINKTLLFNEDNLFLETVNNDLYQYNLTNKKLLEHKSWKKKSESSMDSNLVSYNENIIFFDNNGLLKKYDINTFETSPISLLKDYSFTSIQKDERNIIWLTSKDNKLLTYEIEKNVYTIIKGLESKKFIIKNTSIIEASMNWIWLGSYEQGVMLINRKEGSFWVFNENNKLSNNVVNGFITDNDQNLWLSTNKGISHINPKTRHVNNYNANFGVTDNEFLYNSMLKTSKNKIYFGGTNGFHSFIPEVALSTVQQVNHPIFLHLLISNKKVNIKKIKTAESEFSITKHINELSTLTLQHNQWPFSIEFTSPNPKLPNQVLYKYRLVGLDDEWIETDNNNRRATYTNLDAGEYFFEVQAINLLNSTNSKTKKIKIIIMPPWWLSNSAILLYALIAIFIITYIFQQMRHKRLYHLQIQLSEERLKLSLWGSGDEMWDWNIKSGKIFRSNIWGILEFPQDGKRNVGADQTNIHQQDIPRIRQALAEHFDKKTDHFESTYRVKDKDGKWIWILDRGKIVERDESDVPTRMTGTLKDISQIKRADERLKLFAKCIENISDAVVIYDRQFTVVDVNKAYQRITQNDKKQMLGTTLLFNQYPESFTQNVKKHLITQGSWHGEIDNKLDNGKTYITDLNIDIIKDENNNISHFVSVFSDVSERKKNEAELRKLANSDTLTGLPNRSYFQANQTRLVKTKVPHALLVFDLDNFKKINDSMGHGVGDSLLVTVAKRILSSSRKQDAVYRLGGDEFSIIIENTNDIHTITTIAKQILTTIAQPMKLNNQEVVLYSSIGIVLYPEDGTSPQELLKNADTAMYHAKDNGGNKYQFFSDSMNKKAVKRLQIENLIRHGLKEDFFSVFYQPKIEINTGKVAGMEALVRFQTPSKGIISPVVFIPVSEETGQIIDIGEVVLRKSCIATKQWVDSGLFEGRIAVNLSAVQFTQPNLVGMIADILRESGLPAKHLELEITEGTVMDSPQKAIDTMLQIRAMGIHLSLDDFGTGYSSLAYLKKFPLNTLKIDKAFVDDIETSEQGRNMVATIVTIAHNLGLHVVAEGVESEKQLNFLSGLDCEQLQGYLYSKPLPENDFQKYLLSHQITDNSTSFHNI